MKRKINRTATVIVTRQVEEEVDTTFEVEQVFADWEANRDEVRWVVRDEFGIVLEHYATEDAAVLAIESGDLDEFVEAD